LSTRALLNSIDALAASLRRLGVEAGDRVSFKLEKRPSTLALAHACLKLGVVMHPLDIAYTNEETEYLLLDAQPALVVCEPRERGELGPLARWAGIKLATLADLHEGPAGDPGWADVGPDATAALLYTSGTTGKPKGARITHRNLAMSARALAAVWRMAPHDVLLHALPLTHAHGLLTSINTLLLAGGSLLFMDSFDPARVAAALPEATLMMGVPTHYARLLGEPNFTRAATSSLRLAISGSAPLPLGLAQRFAERAGLAILERYGTTEAAIVTAVPPATRARAGWVGWPLEGVEVRVAGGDGARSSRQSVGILETRGHNVFAGYWRRPDADAEAFTDDGWFITGDIAEIDAEGCVRLLGREKDLVISGGLNVYPKEVEIALDSLPAISESAVFGVPHPDLGEGVVAVVETEDGRCDEERVIAALRKTLAGYKTPKRVIAGELPRNHMGKVLKTRLRETYRDLFQTGERS